MVAKMMRWRPWPPAASKKYEVRLVVRKMEGVEMAKGEGGERLTVEIRWKGNKNALKSLRRNVRRNFTREEKIGSDGVVSWDEEFLSVCNMYCYKETAFHPWEIAFTVFDGCKGGLKSKTPIIGAASLNLSQFAPPQNKEFEIRLPLSFPGGSSGPLPTLYVTLNLSEVMSLESAASTMGSSSASPPAQLGEAAGAAEKDEFSAIKAGLRRVKILTEFVSIRKPKKSFQEEEGSEGRLSAPSYDGDDVSPSGSESREEDSNNESSGEEEAEEEASGIRKSFSYGTLASANCAGGTFYSATRVGGGDEDWMRYDRMSDESISTSSISSSPPPSRATKRSSLLSWRKRKLSFRSPKTKGEPLLKKAYGEDGGDDIDFDRRQLSSDESIALRAARPPPPDFGDDEGEFAVGLWESKEIASRDGKMRLKTPVFFASIDQRSEQAAGESACTVLVAVIADWLQSNPGEMPIKSQFDKLIRDGSCEWRRLCGQESYRRRFPDKHLDLEAVVEAGICQISVSQEKSFVGFFSPEEGAEEGGGFEFLQGAMSFDSIWEEMVSSGSCPREARVYIIGWNDHFFVLKVDDEVCYIVDTLGERLQEGCGRAYILKFDDGTELTTTTGEEVVAGKAVLKGTETCREYIKSFLAAIPIRELAAEAKKGGLPPGGLHQRLQIEFHYTVEV